MLQNYHLPLRCTQTIVIAIVCSLIIYVAVDVSHAQGQQVPVVSSAWNLQETVEDDILDDESDDVLNLIDSSLENLSRQQVIAPALQEVVSTVSRQKTTVGRTPSAVYVVTPEMIRRSGATSIPEALRMVPGLSVAKRDSNKWAITARGFNARYANKLLVQIDGRTVYTPVFAGTYWDIQDVVLEDVQRIEVIRGPGATVWGANAVNGVINIITKSAKDTHGVYVKAGGGSEEQGVGILRLGGSRGDLSWRAYGKWNYRDRGLAIGGPAQDDWRKAQGGIRTDWTPNDCDTFTLHGDVYSGTSGDTFFGYAPNDANVQGHNVIGRWSRKVDDDNDTSFQIYYDANDRVDSTLSQHVETLDVDFQNRFPLACYHNLIWGLGYRRVKDILAPTTSPAIISFNPSSAAKHTFSGFLQDEITLSEDFSYLTIGTKISRNDFTGFEVQPSIRLLCLPSDISAAWAAVSRAVRIPSRFHSDSFTNQGFQTNGPSPGFGSEELIAYELGFRAQPTQNFSWDLALFVNDYENLKSNLQTGFGFPTAFVNVNSMSGEAYGMELSCKYQATECWNLSAWYSYVQYNLRETPTALPSVAEEEGSSPQHQAYLMSSWDLCCNWEFDLMARYVDSLPAQTVPSYIELDLRLGWYPTDRLEVSIVGQNLLDSSHLEFGNLGGAPTPLVESQRGVYATATWRY